MSASLPVVIDIETVPLAASLGLPYRPDDNPPPSNYKNPDAIAGHHAKGEAAWQTALVKKASLNPRLGRVLCIGTASTDNALAPECYYAETEGDEAGILAKFWMRVGQENGRVVTWNGSFDLRFLVIRSLAHNLVPLVSPAEIGEWFNKYKRYRHYDVKTTLVENVREAGEGLDEWATFFNCGGKAEGMDGSKVYPLYLAGQHDTIRDYCLDDVVATRNLYEYTRGYFDTNSNE